MGAHLRITGRDPFPPPARRSLDELTPRQLEVLELMSLGLCNQTIAERLWISPRTLEGHVREIFVKLCLAGADGLDRRVAAVVVFREAYETSASPSPLPSAALAAGEDDLVSVGAQDLCDRLTMIALQFDDAVLDGPADAAALLQPAGELLQCGVVDWNAGDRRRRLAFTAGRLAAHLHRAGVREPLLELRIAGAAHVAVAARPDHV
jgi:DNA-binding CsgD family transcriptional regulator